jgi:predicted dehydrogenase
MFVEDRPMLKIGMIGAGFVAKFHERVLRSVRNAELAGVYVLKGAEALAQLARQDGLGDPRRMTLADLVRAVDVVASSPRTSPVSP